MKHLEVKVGGDSSGFDAMVARVNHQAEHMASHLTDHIGKRIAGMFAAEKIEEAIKKTIEYASTLTDLSGRTGVSVENLQRLDAATKAHGTSLDALVGLWERIGTAREKALRNPGGQDAQAFKKLGVNSDELKTGSADELVRQMAKSFQDSTNVTELIAPLRELGGRAAGEMIDLLRAGYDQQYRDLQVMTGEEADVLKELEEKAALLQRRIMSGVSPALIWLIDVFRWVQDKLVSIFTWWKVGADATDKGATPEQARAAASDAYRQSEAENKAEAEQEAKERKERVKRRLEFGKVDLSDIHPTQKKEHLTAIKEIQLDELSKAGLFAGGAGSGMVSNIPFQQLQATLELVEAVKETNDTLDERL